MMQNYIQTHATAKIFKNTKSSFNNLIRFQSEQIVFIGFSDPPVVSFFVFIFNFVGHSQLD